MTEWEDYIERADKRRKRVMLLSYRTMFVIALLLFCVHIAVRFWPESRRNDEVYSPNTAPTSLYFATSDGNEFIILSDSDMITFGNSVDIEFSDGDDCSIELLN